MKTEPKVKKTKQKKERSHSIANTKKVAVALIKNPTGTLREIAEEAGVSHQTVDNKLGQLGQIKEDWLEELLSVDIDIVKLGTKEIKRRFENEEELKQIKATDVSAITKESTARYMAFRGDATDAKGGLNAETLKAMSVDELLSIIKQK